MLTDQELNSAIAISQASPGPLGLYVVVVGYFVAGVPGALAGALALASPAILAIPIARAVRRHRDSQVRGGSAAIVIASCVLMATTSVRLAPDAAPNSVRCTRDRRLHCFGVGTCATCCGDHRVGLPGPATRIEERLHRRLSHACWRLRWPCSGAGDRFTPQLIASPRVLAHIGSYGR